MHTKDTGGPGCPLLLASNSFTEGFFFLSEQHSEWCFSCGAAAPADHHNVQSARRSEPACKHQTKLTIKAETHAQPSSDSPQGSRTKRENTRRFL